MPFEASQNTFKFTPEMMTMIDSQVQDTQALSTPKGSYQIKPITQQVQKDMTSTINASQIQSEGVNQFNPSEFLKNSLGNMAIQKINQDKFSKQALEMRKSANQVAFNKRQELKEMKSEKFTIEGMMNQIQGDMSFQDK